MTPDSQKQLWDEVYTQDGGLTGLGLWVLADKLSFSATGMEMFAAAKLAATYLTKWVPFTAWCGQRGLASGSMPVPELLATVYGWLTHNVSKESDLQKLNRQVFGTSNPW